MHRRLSVIMLLLAFAGSALPGPFSSLAQGQVYTDSMDSADTGLLSTETFDPTISFAYLNGQFVVDVQQPSYRGDIISTLNVPELASSRLTVDAFIEGDPANKYVIAGCRHTDAGEGYFFGYLPATGDVLIWRRDASGDTNISGSVEPSLIAPANTPYQIGIDCWTNVITGIVNGQPVVSAFDATYETGRPAIGLGANGQQTGGLKVAFDNLTVTDNGNLELASANTVTPTPADLSVAAPTVAAPDVATIQTVPMTDPNVDPAATLSEAFTVSLNLPPLVSGLGADIEVSLANIYQLPASVQVSDFYAELYFTTPTVPPGTSYLAGFCFWTDPAGECYDVFIADDGTGASRWGYGYDTNDGVYESLQTGEMPAGSLDPTPGATNFLGLTVYQGVAILSSNTFDADVVIPLDGTPIAGDVQAEFAFLDENQSGVTDPLQSTISDFAVWDLSSGMVPVVDETGAVVTEPAAVVEAPTTEPVTVSGPVLPPLQSTTGVEALFDLTRTAVVLNPPLIEGLSGSFTEGNTFYSYAAAGVNLADFYTIATFTNPSDAPAPFDIGIGFRDDRGSEGGLRFTVTSAGTWYIQLPGQEPYASGAATSFVSTPGAINTIEVLVQGSAGTVAINGVLLPQFDFSTVPNRGDVYLGAGFFQGDTVEGRAIAYSDWWIYPTDILDFPSG